MLLSTVTSGAGALGRGTMPLKIIAASLLLVWLILVVLGKGGFVHLLLFNALGVGFVELLRMYRTNMKEPAVTPGNKL